MKRDGNMGVFDKYIIEEDKPKIGSSFGGGWGLSDLIKKEKEKKTEEENVFTKYLSRVSDNHQTTDAAVKATGTAVLEQPEQKQYGLSPTGNVAASMTNLKPEMDDFSKKVIQVVGGIQGFKITEPELYQEIKDIRTQIASEPVLKAEGLKPAALEKITRIAKAQELLTGTPVDETFKDIVSQQDKGDKTLTTGFLFGKQDIHLPKEYNEAATLVTQTERFSTSGQVMDFLQTASRDILIGNLAINAARIAFKATPELWDKIKNKDIVKHYTRDEILQIWDKVERGVANKTEEALIKTIAKEESIINAIKQGYNITQTVPRFATAAGKLYAGLPADEIAKAIIETGKVTADVVKGLDPVKVSQVTQQLMNTAPALANEFLKAVEKPESIVSKIPTGVDRPETPVTEPVKEVLPKTEPKLPETEIPSREAISKVEIPEKVIEQLRTDPKFPEIEARINEEVLPKVDAVIEQEMLKAGIKLPDMPNIKESIIPVVEKAIEETILPKTEIKLPDIPVIEKEVLIKVRETVKEELPKITPKAPEITIPKKEVITPKPTTEKPAEVTRTEPKLPEQPIIEQEEIAKAEQTEIKREVPRTEAKEPESPPVEPPIPPTTTPTGDSEVGNPIDKLNELIKKAKPLRSKLQAEYTKERGKRIAEVERIITEVGGEKGYELALSKLKGELARPESKAIYEGVKEKLTQEETDSLYNTIFKHPYIDEWEKVSASAELTKLFQGELPTPKGLVLLEEIFGTDLIKNILAKRALGFKVVDFLIDLANLPRAIMATADMSGFLRQGVVYVASHPVIAAKDMMATFRFAFSPKAFEQYFKDLKNDKLYPLMRKSDLAITDPSRFSASAREEAFMSHLLEKVPIIGSILRFSERSYVGFLTKLRVDVFKTHADDLLSKGFSPVKDADLFKATAEMVNTFTGRGSLGAYGNRIAPLLNNVFFSPRLIAARFKALNPIWYARQSKPIRLKAIGDFAKFVAAGITLLVLASLAGFDVETDPRSSDFGKVKIDSSGFGTALAAGIAAFFGVGVQTYGGKTRFDSWGGFVQWCRVMGQVITGQRKNSSTGEIVSLTKDEYPFTTRKEVILRFIEGKFAPVPSLINELISGAKTFEGEDITPEIIAKQNLIPMYIQDIADAYTGGEIGRAGGYGIAEFESFAKYVPNKNKSITSKYLPESQKKSVFTKYF
jgi:Skp family chaperone for outer membrane proteins